MSTATHPVTPEEIMALLDGELPADRAPAVATHTESCATCQQTFASLLYSANSLKSWTVGEMTSLSDAAVLASVRERDKGKPFVNLLRSPNRARTLLWAAGLVTAVLVLMAISIPNLLRSRMAANEASSVGSLRTINTAAVEYQQKYGHYPQSLKDLGPPQNGQPSERGADLLDSVLSNGDKSGYRYDYRPVPGSGYRVNAEPLQAGSSGQRRFSTDQTGVLLADNAPLDGSSQHYVRRIPLGGNIAQAAKERELSESPAGPMIARTVSLAVIVKDFSAARSSLDTILARHSGYSANLSVSTPQDAARSLQASLRVPAPQLAAALGELKALGRVEAETQNGEEVTQQHADLVARLKNSRETEQRLQAILTQRTGKISDVLEVEQEIARVRGEIEQMEAEQKNLEHRVDFATIDLKISEEYKAQLNSPAPSVSTQIHNALVNGYRKVADTLLGLVLFFAEYGPVLLLWCAFLLIPAYLVWRRWRAATAAA